MVNVAAMAAAMRNGFFMGGLVVVFGWARKRECAFDRMENAGRVKTGAGKIFEIVPGDASIRGWRTFPRAEILKTIGRMRRRGFARRKWSVMRIRVRECGDSRMAAAQPDSAQPYNRDPSKSFSFIIPRRMRAFTVPSGSPSRSEISVCVSEEKNASSIASR